MCVYVCMYITLVYTHTEIHTLTQAQLHEGFLLPPFRLYTHYTTHTHKHTHTHTQAQAQLRAAQAAPSEAVASQAVMPPRIS